MIPIVGETDCTVLNLRKRTLQVSCLFIGLVIKLDEKSFLVSTAENQNHEKP